ncbi:hypothetical protein V9T40_008668 [Parthenolecanium corni]|uniref:Ubiquitin-like domain-containing protein n=1 Tax=Parthenolecanium corni TaxID=536013 RepID=A0AAN9TNZ9_9HEMI
MKIQVKLLEREPFMLEVRPEESVAIIKEMVYQYLRIPIEEQKLIFRGRILKDNETLQCCPQIADGSKLHLIMVTKKKHPLYNKVYEILRPHFSEKETQKILCLFMRKVYDSFRQLSLDDLERIARGELSKKSVHKPEKMIIDDVDQ